MMSRHSGKSESRLVALPLLSLDCHGVVSLGALAVAFMWSVHCFCICSYMPREDKIDGLRLMCLKHQSCVSVKSNSGGITGIHISAWAGWTGRVGHL